MKKSAFLLPVFFMSVIFYFSHQPTVVKLLPSFLYSDKVVHALAYFILGSSWWIAFLFQENLRQIWNSLEKTGFCEDCFWKKIMAYAVFIFILTSLYGVSDEWHQTFVPGRSFEFADMLADAAGALLSCVIFSRLILWYVRKISTTKI